VNNDTSEVVLDNEVEEEEVVDTGEVDNEVDNDEVKEVDDDSDEEVSDDEVDIDNEIDDEGGEVVVDEEEEVEEVVDTGEVDDEVNNNDVDEVDEVDRGMSLDQYNSLTEQEKYDRNVDLVRELATNPEGSYNSSIIFSGTLPKNENQTIEPKYRIFIDPFLQETLSSQEYAKITKAAEIINSLLKTLNFPDTSNLSDVNIIIGNTPYSAAAVNGLENGEVSMITFDSNGILGVNQDAIGIIQYLAGVFQNELTETIIESDWNKKAKEIKYLYPEVAGAYANAAHPNQLGNLVGISYAIFQNNILNEKIKQSGVDEFNNLSIAEQVEMYNSLRKEVLTENPEILLQNTINLISNGTMEYFIKFYRDIFNNFNIFAMDESEVQEKYGINHEEILNKIVDSLNLNIKSLNDTTDLYMELEPNSEYLSLGNGSFLGFNLIFKIKEGFQLIIPFDENFDPKNDSQEVTLEVETSEGRQAFQGTLTVSSGIIRLSTETGDMVYSIRSLQEGNPDPIVGTLGDDTIFGIGGGDTIHGVDGDNLIHGGDGNDSLMGGDGDDSIYGGGGNDTIDGGGGNNYIDNFDLKNGSLKLSLNSQTTIKTSEKITLEELTELITNNNISILKPNEEGFYAIPELSISENFDSLNENQTTFQIVAGGKSLTLIFEN
jgi:hypothetical protein